MSKKVNKLMKILLLIAMILSDLMTPIKVLADEITSVEPSKGDIGINGAISDGGNSVTVSAGAVRNEDGTLTNEGDISVTKTVSKVVDEITGEVIEGRYKIEFNIKGKDITNTSTTTKPVYVVVVFDRSGSMEDYERVCTRYETYRGEEYCADWDSVEVKFSSAVDGAQTFAETLLTNIPDANIALVTFAKDVTVARNFNGTDEEGEEVEADLSNADFGSPNEGTNLHAGLKKANELLSSSDIATDANKYVVVISDGEPTYYVNSNGGVGHNGMSTNKDVLDATFAEADDIKTKIVDGEEVEDAEIFAIGYSLPSGNVYNDTNNSSVPADQKYGALTAADILTAVATEDSAEDVENNISHYINAEPAAIVTAFTNIATEIGKTPAGTGSTLTDNLGTNFKLVAGETNTFSIDKITETGTTVSFEIEVDQSKITEDGWYDTNAGFTLTYTDANGNDAKIEYLSTQSQPQVWLTPEVYEYTVNYYKDSFDTTAIASDVREATNGTIINESNVEKDKYLNNSGLGTEGYEFNSINPEYITIDSNGKTINVLYTIKKFSYVVNYYYDGNLEDTITQSNVNYGTLVESTSYYLDASDIKEGYSLDTVNSDSADFTITDNTVVIDIYYKKNSYNYVVNYYFNNNIDNDFTKNSSALFGTVIEANKNYLDDTTLESKESEDNIDYFINPILPSNPSQITIGTNVNENVINIYYVSTVVTDEDIEKIASTDKITSGETPITYTVNYTSVVNNVNKGDTVKVVITDTLPLEIEESKSNLNGGVYNASSKTITWTFETTMEEFTEEFDASKTIGYTVIYKNVGNGDGYTLTNSVIGNTTAGGKTTTDKGDSTDVVVEIPGKVTAIYVDESDNTLADSVVSNGLVGESYTTTAKDIFGYTLTGTPDNATGVYAEEDITVKYVYTKNDGTIDDTEIVKTATNGTVQSIDDTFGYTITATGEVRDYVGDVTVKVTDNLPYELTEEAINNLSDECVYDGASKTITCTRVITIDEEDYVDGVYNVNETFNLELTFVGVDSETVTNTAKVEIILDSNVKDDDTDEEDVTVETGKVTATYKDTDGNALHEDVTTEDLVGKEYTTEEKSFFGYTLVEVPENKDGVYTKEDILVEYVYDKNDGTIDETEVVKTAVNGTVDSIDSTFGYTITATGKVREYVGDVTVKVTDNLPYELTEEAINNLSDECVYDGASKTITCTRVITIDEEDYVDEVYNVNEVFNLELEFVEIDSETVTNTAKVEIILDSNVKDEDDDTEETEVYKGTVVATYKDTLGNTLHEDITTSDLAGKEYTTETKEFYGYSLVEVPSNKNGTYLVNATIYVDYVYSKNIGTSEEELVKNGLEVVDSVDSEFKYVITYNTIIKDYIGAATLVITDELPYEIDLEKSVFGDSCEYIDGKLVCTYKKDITKEDNKFAISEIFSLYYLNVDNNMVTNKASSVLTYGNVTKENDSEYTSEVKEGNVIVNYVTTDGTKLADSITLTGMVGEGYATNKKEFDKYNFIEVVGDTEGEYIDGTIEVTYVYDITPLPPQTGVDMNLFIYVKYLVLAAIILVSGKTYKLLKNN